MSSTRLQVLASETLKSKSGNEYQVLKCVVHGVKLDVGTLRVYGELAKTPVQPGDYTAEWDLGVGYGDDAGNIVPRLQSLIPLRPASSKL